MIYNTDTINKSQSVAHSKISPRSKGLENALTFCVPDISTTTNIHNSSEYRIPIRRKGATQVISCANTNINPKEFDNSNSNITELTKKIIEQLDIKNIKLDFYNPSHEGGKIFEFHIGNDYHLIELFSDGDIVLLKRNSEIKLREVNDLDEKSLFDYLNSL